MTTPVTLTDLDWAVRHFVYTFFVENARPPSVTEAAVHFALPEAEARASYQRLNARHHLFLEPGTDTIRLANPLSAVPTRYRVRVQGHDLWANCAWDSLGIPAMLDADATVEARDPLSEAPITYAVHDGQLVIDPGYFMHFPLPAARWYDDLVFT